MSISFSSTAAMNVFVSSWLVIDVLRDWACCWVIRPAATSELIRFTCCCSRNASTCARSLNWSLVIVWPSTVAAAARCWPYHVVAPTTTRMSTAITTASPNPTFM